MLSHGSSRQARPARPASPGLGGGWSMVACGVPYLVPLAGGSVAFASGILAAPALAAITVSAVGCGLVRAAVEHVRVVNTRDGADRWIGARTGQPPSDEILRARIDELVSARTRASLGRAFRRVAADALGAGPRVTPAQLNRRVLRPHVDDLVQLADRLEDLSVPVAPRGVALAHRLITAGGGPLYNSRHAEMLPGNLSAALTALDVV
jgi:hypothetical protein